MIVHSKLSTMSAIHPKKIYCIEVTIKHSILDLDNENDMSNNFALLKYQVHVNRSPGPRRVERPTKPRGSPPPLLLYSPTTNNTHLSRTKPSFTLYGLIFHADPTFLMWHFCQFIKLFLFYLHLVLFSFLFFFFSFLESYLFKLCINFW